MQKYDGKVEGGGKAKYYYQIQTVWYLKGLFLAFEEMSQNNFCCEN